MPTVYAFELTTNSNTNLMLGVKGKRKRKSTKINKNFTHETSLEVYDGPAPNLPDGWKMKKIQRAQSDRIDLFWYSPTGKKFRSSVEVKRFRDALEITNGDECEAYEKVKRRR